MTSSSLTPRLYGLDTLRALAIVLVFANHYELFVAPGVFGFWGQIGWTGVDLFFALSGYLIGNQIFAALRSRQGFSLPHFYARRFLRTLPNFYFVLALYYLWPAFRGDYALLPLWKFLTFTQNINLTPGTAFSHAWSLCVEEQFYVLLPAVALLIAACRKSLLWAWVAVAASFAAGMLVRAYLWDEYVQVPRGGMGYYKYIYYASWCRFDELVAGVALALLKNHHPAAWSRITAYGNRTLLAGLAGAALMLTLFFHHHFDYWVTVLGYPALAISFSLLLVAAMSPGSALYQCARAGRGQPGPVVVCDLFAAQAAVHLAQSRLAGPGLRAGRLAGGADHDRRQHRHRLAAVCTGGNAVHALAYALLSDQPPLSRHIDHIDAARRADQQLQYRVHPRIGRFVLGVADQCAQARHRFHDMRAVVGVDQQQHQVGGAGAGLAAQAVVDHVEQGALHARRGIGDIRKHAGRVADGRAQAPFDLVRLDVGGDIEIRRIPVRARIRVAGRKRISRFKTADAAQGFEPC